MTAQSRPSCGPVWIAVALCGFGCESSSSTPSGTSGEQQETTTSTSETTQSASETTPPLPDGCENTNDCDTDAVCAGAYDPGLPGRLPASCVQTCIEINDLSRWCPDDTSCCPGSYCNEVDGFCLPLEAGDTTTTTTTTASSTSGGATTIGTDTDGSGTSTG